MAQLQLDLHENESPRPKRRACSRSVSWSERMDGLGGALLHWAPVWIPAILLTQILVLGLRPALREERRLDAAEQDVAEREAALADAAATVERHRRMLADGIYRERVRRNARVAGATPLLLDDRHASARGGE